jgi:hypothetical protein
MEKHRAFTELIKEVTHPTNLQVVEASITDLRERQYNAEIASGSSIELAEAVSGWKKPKA